MKRRLLGTALILCLAVRAAVPEPAQLFPQDTLLLATIPDGTAARAAMGAAPFGRLWNDPAMRSFRDKFEEGFRTRFLAAADKDLGLKLEDWAPLVRGQLSLAFLRADWDPSREDSDPTMVLLMDARDRADELRGRLTEIRTRLDTSRWTLRSRKIRDIEFWTLLVDRPLIAGGEGEEPSAQPDDEGNEAADGDAVDGEDGPTEPWELTFGQVDTVLVLATGIEGLERVVARLTGGSVPAVGDLPEFQTAAAAGEFRNATGYAYLQAGAVLNTMTAADADGESGGVFGIQPNQLMAALGIDGLQSVSGSVHQSEAGMTMKFLAAVPESGRKGLFQLLRFEIKDASPPTFVPADAVEFQRIRLNGARLWTGVEALVRQVSPQLGTLLSMSLGSLGKDRDPQFDFQKMFFGNLGDDWISYRKAPRGKSAAELANPPSITLVGVVNADQMLAAIRSVGGLLPGGPDDLREREVNGRKVLTLKLPAVPGQPVRTLEISAVGGYVAFASDTPLLEEFLRSVEGAGKPLRELPGLGEAAQRVGGMDAGIFSFQNQRESAAGAWEMLRQDGWEKLVPGMKAPSPGSTAPWPDFSALPPFETVSKYFGISVSSAGWESRGFQIRSFTPVPKSW